MVDAWLCICTQGNTNSLDLKLVFCSNSVTALWLVPCVCMFPLSTLYVIIILTASESHISCMSKSEIWAAFCVKRANTFSGYPHNLHAVGCHLECTISRKACKGNIAIKVLVQLYDMFVGLGCFQEDTFSKFDHIHRCATISLLNLRIYCNN